MIIKVVRNFNTHSILMESIHWLKQIICALIENPKFLHFYYFLIFLKLIFLSQNFNFYMENENIPYRNLRDTKRGKTGTFSVSLLGRPQKRGKSASQKQKKHNQSLMKMNVVQYQHLIRNPQLSSKNITWVTNLRQNYVAKQNNGDDIQFMVPSVYSKTTQARTHYLEARQNKQDKQRCFNTADFDEILSRKKCSMHLDQGALRYATNLRLYPEGRKTDKGKENKQNDSKKKIKEKLEFTSIAFKQRNQFPTFLTKDSMKKMKNIRKNQLQSAFDGSQNYPAFTQKILKQKNYGVFKQLTNNSLNKPDLPTLAWQMGLRHY